MNTRDFYNYQKPEKTYTLDQYIACQSDTVICYNNLSFIDEYSNFRFNTYNVLSDYVDDIRKDYCLKVVLDDEQMLKYKYRPKQLCYDIYGNGELAFIILIINDMYSIKDFTKNKIYMPTKVEMAEITKKIFNTNKQSISIYNEKNKDK